VVPFPAGSTPDLLARAMAERLAAKLGQQFLIENKPGAGGMIGAQAVATSAPDGYTVLFANSGLPILGAINKNLTFDPIGDFAGVFLAGEAPGIVVVPPSLGVSNLKEFVELAKSKPGTINYGSAGASIISTAPGTECWRRARRRSPSWPRSTRQWRRPARTPNCWPRSASKASSRVISDLRNSTPTSALTWCASILC
jgi:hypothetical protein